MGYIPFSHPKPAVPSSALPTNTRPTTTLSPVCAYATTTSPGKAYGQPECLGSGLGAIRTGSEVESDVLAVEAICLELMKAEVVVAHTGFGFPLTVLSKTARS
jgi:hypothetical protein